MATTVTLESDVVEAVMVATKEISKASGVRTALREYLRQHRLRGLADLAGTIDLQYSNEEIEAMEEC